MNTDRVVKLECNLDDMTGEALAYAAEVLLEAGALDVWTAPIFMKKGRPAQLLSVLCKEGEEERFAGLLFMHTTTLGARITGHERFVMERRPTVIETGYGSIPAKEAEWDGFTKEKPEFDALREIAKKHGVPLSDIK